MYDDDDQERERERTDNNSMACSAVHKKETRHGPTAKPIFIII